MLAPACARAPERGRPDVILVSIDTLRADRLGLYGHERDTSPFLERFARGARVFERAYSAAPWTLPSHLTMLTGLYPDMEALRDLGYAGEVEGLGAGSDPR